MAEASLLRVFEGSVDEETSKKWFDRLVWAELPVGNVKLWWPALRFVDIAEFDREHQVEATGNLDLDYRYDLAACLAEKVYADDGPVQVVRFLGRPLTEVRPVHQQDVLNFIGHLNTRQGVFDPQYFVDQLGLDRARTFYDDFHHGMDDFAKILHQLKPRPPTFVPWATKAQRVWEQFFATRHQPMALAIHQDPPIAQLPPQPPSLRQDHSPNHSVAAVSVADDSVVSVNHRHRVNQSNPTNTKLLSSSNNDSIQRAHNKPQQLDHSKLPKLGPLGIITWKEVRVQLICAGWTKFKNSQSVLEQYRPYPTGPLLSLEETKDLCQQHYGWQPLSEAAPHTPNRPSHHQELPHSNAKNYSFGFLWKHKCLPDGWKQIKPPKGADASVDYYYLRPGFTRQNMGVKNQDYFDDHYQVLEWCKRNNYYPSSDWTTGDDVSEATEVADDPSAYLDQVEPPQGQVAKTKKGNKKKQTQRNYSFGVLWARHLEPSGWTMPKAKRNPLIDYYYVRPGCTVAKGKLGVDYFATTDAVLEYCAKHNDYPESSGASTCSPDDGTIGTATLANEDTTDDESTKIPAETEDEANKPIMEEDDNTLGDFSTPGTKTQPQDPGKPLLREEDSTPELDDEEKYYWKNLWPVLKKQRGWSCIKAKNAFDDWWYIKPRTLTYDGVKTEMVKGVDYFTTEQEVIEFCKQVDREDTLSRLKANKDGDPKQKKSDHSHHKIHRNESKDPKASHQKKSKPKRKIIENKVPEPMTAKNINVKVAYDKNIDAPWVSSPLPTNLHSIVTSVGDFNYSGSYYYLHNETYKKFSRRFEDIAELLKHLCSLGRGNYFVNQEAKIEEINQYIRLIDYAYVPGSTMEHREIRPLTKEEIILCLKEVFQFTFTDGEWHVPRFLRTKSEQELQENTLQLRPSYASLPELLKALRGIEHLEDESGRRRRKPLDKKSITEQRDHLIMAFRLSIAEDAVIDGLNNQRRKKMMKASNAELDDRSECSSSVSAKNKKRGSPGSASKKDSKKHKPDGKFEIEDLKVKWKDEFNENPAPWVSLPVKDFSSAKPLGISYQGGYYYLHNESFTSYSARFTSIDGVFTHLCTYGNYSLRHLDANVRLAMKKLIALGNVPGPSSYWKKYRLLDTWEATAILGLLGFQEEPDKSWIVPEVLLQQKNPFRKGTPALINSKYPSLDDLRVALRCMPDLDVGDGGRRRRPEGKLNEHQMKAFRLWLASGPEGPDDTRVIENTDAESSADELPASRTVEEAMTPENSQIDSLKSHDAPDNDQIDNGNFCSAEATFQSHEPRKVDVSHSPVDPDEMMNNPEVAQVMESQDAPFTVDNSTIPCGSEFISNDSPTIDSLREAHDINFMTPIAPQGGSKDLPMSERDAEPTNESVHAVRVSVNPLMTPEKTSVQGVLKSSCSLHDDTEMADADVGRCNGAKENVCPNIFEVCMGNSARDLLTQPCGDSVMSDESDDDENATFINYGHVAVTASPTSPAETKTTEDTRKVYSVEQGGTWNGNQGTWLTQACDDV